jgi:glyoxylase-like metal-dependent hydrolase (beta-lactamase superfamily II)
MIGWNKVYDISVIPMIPLFVNVWQVRRVSKGCIAYVIASNVDNNAAVIDPSCETNDAILEIANDNALKITKVIDTHMHADHVSGAASLAKRIVREGKVPIYFSSLEGYDFPQNRDGADNNNDNLNFKKIQGDDEIQVGKNVNLKVLHTPGHTYGSMCFLLESLNDITKQSNNDVRYLFAGDTVFVDGIGRPDLHNKAEEYANNLYTTFKEKILNLSDKTIILPAHYNKSFTHEKPIFNTLGVIKEEVKFLSMSRDEFISSVSSSIRAQPINYKTIIHMNKNKTLCDKAQIQDLEAGPNLCGIHI